MLGCLEEHGFLVVSGVLGPQDCETALELARDWIEAASFAEHCTAEAGSASPNSSPRCTGRIVEDREARSCFPRSVEGGIQPFYGSGHSTIAWFVRGHRNVRRVFAALHNARPHQLLSSLDGIILWPIQYGKVDRPDAGWFHLDQNPRHKPGRQDSVQGLVNLLPVTPGTGGNTLVARSHRLFPSHYTMARRPLDGDDASRFYEQRLEEVGADDWLEIDPGDSELLDPARILMLQLSPGDVLLWDSRTAHCSYPPRSSQPTEDPGGANLGLIRAATLVSMLPSESETVAHDALRARHRSTLSLRTLTHWVNKAAPLGDERPDQVALEHRRVAAIREWEQRNGKVLLSWDDLSADQRKLVVGDLVHLDPDNFPDRSPVLSDTVEGNH
jgi:hypothetical protein